MRDFRSWPQWLHSELLNWSRWCWLGPYPHPLPPSHCSSYEHNYIPVGNADERVEEERRPIPPNETNALIADRVWRAMPPIPKLVLRVEYPSRHDYPWEFGTVGVARKLKMPVRDYEAARAEAIGRMWAAFERLGR